MILNKMTKKQYIFTGIGVVVGLMGGLLFNIFVTSPKKKKNE